MMIINSYTVKEIGKTAGADIVGIADASRFTGAPEGCKPTDKLKNCNSVIVLGSPFPQEALSKSTVEYTEIRHGMVSKMDNAAKIVAKQIQKEGYKVKVINGLGGKYINGHFFGHISLKHAAELAGLGIINRNYLLTNPQYGNLLWFSAVLTDAQLEADEPAHYTVCDNCNRCVEMCPSGALDNPEQFGQKKCYATCYKVVKGKLELKCFVCRKVCHFRFGVKT